MNFKEPILKVSHFKNKIEPSIINQYLSMKHILASYKVVGINYQNNQPYSFIHVIIFLRYRGKTYTFKYKPFDQILNWVRSWEPSKNGLKNHNNFKELKDVWKVSDHFFITHVKCKIHQREISERSKCSLVNQALRFNVAKPMAIQTLMN